MTETNKGIDFSSLPDLLVISFSKPSYDELLKLNKEYKEKERFMNLELNTYRTTEAALKTKVKESKTYNLQTLKMHKEAKDGLDTNGKRAFDCITKV